MGYQPKLKNVAVPTIQAVEASSTVTVADQPSRESSSSPLPVHLYTIKPENPTVGPYVVIKTEPEPETVTNNDSETAGISSQTISSTRAGISSQTISSTRATKGVLARLLGNQNPTVEPYVVIKTEPEPENVPNNVEETKMAGISSQTTATFTRSAKGVYGNKSRKILLTRIKTEPVYFENTTPPISEGETFEARPREVIQAVKSGEITPDTRITEQQHQPAKLGRLFPLSFESRNRTPLAYQSMFDSPAFQSKSERKKVDVATQTIPYNRQFTHAATDTSDLDPGVVPSQFIVLDPSSAIVLDSTQVSEIHPSRIPGFNPAEIPGFDPSRIPGYDASEEYRAVYVSWNEPVKLDEDLTQSSDKQPDVLSEPAKDQEGACPSNNVTQTLDDVVRFTEFIQDARDKIQIALEKLRTSQSTCRSKMAGFVGTLKNLLGLANNNVLYMISQLTASVRQQQTQFINLAQLVQKLQREQVYMEQQLLKYRKNNSDRKQAMANKRKFTGTSEPRVMICTKEKDGIDFTIKDRYQNQNTKENVHSKQKNNFSCNSNKKRKFENDKKSQIKSAASKRQRLGGSQNERKEKQRLDCRPDTVKFLEEIRHVKGRRVTVSLICRNPKLCEKYTGFCNYTQLKEVFDKIVADPNFITPTEDTDNSGVRKLSLESEFLMTLVKIKMRVPLCYLCSQYKVSRRVVRKTVVKWTGVLLGTLRRVESESGESSLQPLITITKRALNRIQNHGAYKFRTPETS